MHEKKYLCQTCSAKDLLVLDKKKASRISSFLLLVGFVFFVGGYIIGKRSNPRLIQHYHYASSIAQQGESLCIQNSREMSKQIAKKWN